MTTPLPPSTDFTGASQTQAQAKTFITNLRQFLADLLGTDGTADTARTSLGVLAKAGDALTGLLREKWGTSISADATTDLGTATGNTVTVTNTAGATVITSLGGATIEAGTEITTVFSISGGSVTLTHHATSLILPTGADIVVATGDVAIWKKTNGASAYWQCTGYTRANGKPLAGYATEDAEVSIASATTTDLSTSASRNVQITGTTAITSFGTAAAGVVRAGRFSGALTLTHNATSLILPTSANITTAAGDTFEAVSLGSGNWYVRDYQKASGESVAGGANTVGSISNSRYTLYEDFHSAMVRQNGGSGIANWFFPGSGLMMLNGTTLSMPNMFNFVDAASSQTYTNPRQPGKQSFYLAGTSTVGGATLLGVTFSQSGTTQTAAIYAPYKASKNPTFALRQVQLSATAATRILGLADSVAATPTNGIWFRYAAAGNFILVCRSGGVESTVDTGVASDTSTIRKLEFRVTGGGTSVQAYVDDVAKGSAITTNIPSANLGLFLNNGYTGASAGVGAELYELELSIDK